MNECYNIVVVVKVATAVKGGGLDPRRARSRRGGVSENQIAGATAARLTAVAIAIATRPFKFHEISVSNTSSSFVSSIHSFAIISPPNFVENRGDRKFRSSPLRPVQQNDDRKPFCFCFTV